MIAVGRDGLAGRRLGDDFTPEIVLSYEGCLKALMSNEAPGPEPFGLFWEKKCKIRMNSLKD